MAPSVTRSGRDRKATQVFDVAVGCAVGARSDSVEEVRQRPLIGRTSGPGGQTGRRIRSPGRLIAPRQGVGRGSQRGTFAQNSSYEAPYASRSVGSS